VSGGPEPVWVWTVNGELRTGTEATYMLDEAMAGLHGWDVTPPAQAVFDVEHGGLVISSEGRPLSW
jgi:hypothetical protein